MSGRPAFSGKVSNREWGHRLVETNLRPILYGLLFVDRQRRRHANLGGKADPLDVYLRCAALCARSVGHQGCSFRLVTNERSTIEHRLQELDLGEFDILEHTFSLPVPDHLPFWAAHFKLEV